jgi:CubicO group peptidase (beta-lactamase class C family)
MTKRFSLILIAALVWIAQPANAADLPKGDAEDLGLSPDGLVALEEHFQAYIDDGKLAGLATLVARHGKVGHFKTYGMADIADGKPMQEDSIFRIYSMTKPVTGVALMMLYDEGKFELDDPVAKYIPGFADARVFAGQAEDGTMKTVPAKREITVLDLMRHTAGLTYGVFSDTPVDKAYLAAELFKPDQNLADWTDKLAGLPLLYQPGDAWVYSLAVDVQGRLVEILSGMSLDEYFQKRIFEPLGMTDTAFYVDEGRAERLVEIYDIAEDKSLTPTQDKLVVDFTIKPTLFSGGGGLVSTMADYFRFAQMMANGGELDGVRLLKPETVKLMSSNLLPPNLKGINKGKDGLGFGVDFAVVLDPSKQGNGARKGEYFWSGMANTVFWIDPQEDLVAIMMTNVLPYGVYPFRDDMRKYVYEAVVD